MSALPSAIRPNLTAEPQVFLTALGLLSMRASLLGSPCERLTAAKVPSRLVVREGAKHAYPGWEADSALIAEWFDQYLRPSR